MTARPRLLISMLCLLTLVAASCGQKPNVHQPGQRFAGAGEDVAAEELAPGEAAVDAEGNPIGSGTQAAGSTTRTTRTGGGGGDVPGGGGSIANDRVGVTKDKIKIGFHAPLTGAAAVSLDDLKYGNTVFPDWLEETKKTSVYGRKADVIFKNDEYKPTTAVNVCRELVEKERVFMLIGGAGTDQIQACARYAYKKRVPYISAGVTEKVLDKLPNYFAFSATYPDQAPALAKLIKTFDASAAGGQGGRVLVDRCSYDQNNSQRAACAPDPRAPSAVGGTGPTEAPKVAIVYSDTEGFHDARDAFIQAYGGGVTQIPITKYSISQAQAAGVVTQLKNAGVDVVYILTSPTNFGNILMPADGQGYRPRWVGVGLTMGLNLVAATSCGRSRATYEHSIFFSPWFSVKHPLASQWKQAWAEHGGPDDDARGDPDSHDIAFGLWGGSIIQHILLLAAGQDLTRSKFIAAAHRLQNAVAPDDTPAGDLVDVYNPLNSRPGDNFGAEHMHILWVECPTPPALGFHNYFPKGDRPLTTADL